MTQIMVFDAALLNTQHYKIRIKGKWNNLRNGVAPPQHLGVGEEAIERGTFGSPSTKNDNFTLRLYIYIYIYT